MTISLIRRSSVLAAGLIAPFAALAVPLITGEFVFTENRSASSAFEASYHLVLGATSITPAGPGTTAVAKHLPLGSGPDYSLNFVTGPQFPNQYAVRTAYAGQTGRWSIEATDGSGTSSRTTHLLDDVRALPLLTGVTLSGPALTPHVTWNAVDHLAFPGFCTTIGSLPGVPACGLGVDIFNYQVEVRQLTGLPEAPTTLTFTSANIPTATFIGGVLTPAVTAFDIPAGVLLPGVDYIFGVRFTHLDQEGFNPTGTPMFFGENRSTAYALSLVSEPETYALLVPGLLLLGFQARRRARSVRAS